MQIKKFLFLFLGLMAGPILAQNTNLEEQVSDPARSSEKTNAVEKSTNKIEQRETEKKQRAERKAAAKAQAAAEKAKKDEAKRMKKNYSRKTEINAPSSAPLSPREKKLAELLQKYKADQITPSEYHGERAKILAEP